MKMKTRVPDRLSVPVEPLGDTRWERIERRVIEGAAPIQAAPPLRAPVRTTSSGDAGSSRARGLAWTFAAVGWAGAIAIGIAMMFVVRDASEPRATGPTRIVTPAGSSTRIELGDAIVDVDGDTAIEARTLPSGAIELALLRGKVACDVAPRPGRAPFAVIADDVIVSVVGTAFTVERRGEVRVTVSRGHVRVSRAGDDVSLVAGDAWVSDATRVVAAAPPETAGTTGLEPTGAATPADGARANATTPSDGRPADAAKKRPFKPATLDDLRDAEALEKKDPDAALVRYRGMTQSSDTIAGPALYHVARLELRKKGGAHAAIAATREYERRLPRGPLLRDVLKLQIEAYVAIEDFRSAHATARRFANAFPDEKWRLEQLKISTP